MDYHSWLNSRKESLLFRELNHYRDLVDFSSNDYLGFAQSKSLYEYFITTLTQNNNICFGSSGSRLISGNHEFTESLERRLAQFHKAETALLFNSGYVANLGVISSLDDRRYVFLYDEKCHASIRDGLRITLAKSYSFIHNNMQDLKQKLERYAGQTTVYVVVESLYSMDGDLCPLLELIELCQYYQSKIILDEAHSTGVMGPHGEGLAVQYGVEKDIFARIYTFGKALGCCGAVVCTSEIFKHYMINKSRTFIYTTALPIFNIIAISCAYDFLMRDNSIIRDLQKKVRYFKNHISSLLAPYFLDNQYVIQIFMVPGNEVAKSVEKYLLEQGIFVKAILSPTVSPNYERIRITLHHHNTEQDIIKLINCLHTSVNIHL